ncbi:MAG: hypothetical protein GF393_10495, partial [Armatimonadia bacterium]|nr:hypothetical protein [Armatimonadia bacterium]
MRRALIIMALLCACALPLMAQDMVFVMEAEDLPTVASASLVEDPFATGGSAVLLASPAARLAAQVELAAGEHTLLVSAIAPDPAHDAIYVDVPGGSQRLPVNAFGELVTLAHTFTVAEVGPADLTIRPDPNELGVSIDQVGLLRGKPEGIVPLADLDAPADAPGLKPLPDAPADGAAPALAEVTVRDVRLAEVPSEPHARALDTRLVADFDEGLAADWAAGNTRFSNLSGATLTEGRWGRALDCAPPEVDVQVNLAGNHIPRAGTIECWTLLADDRPADRERYLLHLQPTPQPGASPRMPLTVAVIERADGILRLTAEGAPVPVDVALPGVDLADRQWHHVALSWDSRDGALSLWLTVDGAGACATQPCDREIAPFSAMRLGNTHLLGHYAHEGEYAQWGGAVDDLHISDQTLAPREAGAEPVALDGIDLDLALAAEDAAAQWLTRWADLQFGGAWGPWIYPEIDARSDIYRVWTGETEDPRIVRNKYGSSIVSTAYDFLDAWHHGGEERWREVAARSVDFFLRAQDERGYWYQDYLVDAAGRPVGMKKTWARIQDGYQSQPFLYLLYWHRLTGERRAFEAARRCADFVLSVENPNGSWPGTFEVTSGVGKTTGPRGVERGCEYNDYATTDPMRMMITMYHLTGEERYLHGPEGSAGILGIGRWMFDTQIGEGEVRGWCQQYDQDNRPVWSRAFEAPVIEPRVISRFIHPQTLTLSLITGNERYLDLLQETYDWYRSVEVPGEDGGWYYQYLPDGTPVYSRDFETIAIKPDDPDAPKPGRDKLNLRGIERDLNAWRQLGLEGLRESFSGPTEISEADCLARRRAAVQWLRENQSAVRAEVEAMRRDGQLVRG